ncbi:MAG: aminotransferase class I/II-fold pyridoxal phosphate-dependent enzyme, partial [Candidatus Neomarinimicrobiota bacterium]
FSKARALAGARLGMAFAQPAVIDLLNRIKPPYNINQLTQKAALDCLVQTERFRTQVAEIVEERGKLSAVLAGLPLVTKVFPSAANFVLVRFRDPYLVYRRLTEQGTILRDRSAAVAGCLRITVGTPAENLKLIEQLKRIENEENPVY